MEAYGKGLFLFVRTMKRTNILAYSLAIAAAARKIQKASFQI